MFSERVIYFIVTEMIFFVMAIYCYFKGIAEGRKRKEEEKQGKPKIIGKNIAVICLVSIIAFIIFLIIGIRLGMIYGKDTLRRRLNEPIVSTVQLYGYKVVNKRCYRKEGPDKSPRNSFFVDIQDLLPAPFDQGLFLENIETSEKIFQGLKAGDIFPPNDEPNAPPTEKQ